MAKLIFSTITSLDGYVEDETGDFRWGAPDEEVFRFVTDLLQPVGTYLSGRRMYETMVFWETSPTLDNQTELDNDFARIWLAADKVVYSTSLKSVSSDKTRIERAFEAKSVQEMKSIKNRDLTVGGPNLAAQAFEAGLIDECQLFVTTVALGGGKSALPKGVHSDLELLNEVRFRSGVIYLHYRVR